MRDESLFAEGASGVAEGIEQFVNEKEEELQRLRQLQEDLQSELEASLDEISRSRIEAQLSGISDQISELGSVELATGQVAQTLREGMVQGAEWAASAEVEEYQEMLEEYGREQGENLVSEFQEEAVNQVTEQLAHTLRRAMEDTVEDAVSSIFIGLP
jgi:hypothetical protein